MFNDKKESLIVFLLCIVCVLGTYVYMTKGHECKCEPATIVQPRPINVGNPVGNPVGRPAGSPFGSAEK